MKIANTLLHQIEVTSNEIGLSINTEKTQYMKLNQNSDSDDITINSINGKIIAKVDYSQLYWELHRINRKGYSNKNC